MIASGPLKNGRGAFGSALAWALLLCTAHVCGDWDLTAKLQASDPENYDDFGIAVALAGNSALIGAYLSDEPVLNSGAAYIFCFDGAEWTQTCKIVPDDGTTQGRFGSSVAMEANTALIGAYWDDDLGAKSGSAYIYHYDGAEWVEVVKLLADDGTALAEFGEAVALSGSVAVIAAKLDYEYAFEAGAVYVFRYDGLEWEQEGKLTADDGAAEDWFGDSVAVESDVIVVGAMRDDDNGTDSGSAYVFRFNGASWTQEAKLLPDDGQPSDGFGFSVALRNTVVMVGSHRDDDAGDNAGSVYVFSYNGTDWVQQAKLLPDAGASQAFGISCSLSDTAAVIGAHTNSGNEVGSGSAYIFRYDGADWIKEARLLPPVEYFQGSFGWSVDHDGDRALIGSYGDGEVCPRGGAAFVYEYSAPQHPADFYGDGDVDTADLLHLLGCWGDDCGDVDGDGDTDTADLLALLGAWGECPGQPPKRQNVMASR